MPELPEVETIRRQIEPLVAGRTILEAWGHPSGKFAPAVEATGALIEGAGRRGKFLLFPTDDDREIIIHLGMTGSLHLGDGSDAGPGVGPDSVGRDPYVRAWWQLDADPTPDNGPNRTLVYRDVRRFGRIRVVDRGDYRSIPALAAIGPEPFDPDFDGARFAELLRRSRRRLKTQLLSQRPIAGVGNIYADEALWLARINPNVTRLGEDRAEALLEAIRDVLRQGIDNGGTTLRDYRNVEGSEGENQRSLEAYGRAGLPCRRCSSPLRSALIDARTTTWCSTCQRR